MREIKFRVWDTTSNSWFHPTYEAYMGRLSELLLSPGGQICWRTLTGLANESMFPNRFILEQFTGLKDKNGKEIYEGDICKIVVDDTTDDYSISTVKFHDGAFTVDADFGEYDTSAIGWAITDCENGGGYIQVLGNIHENPEPMEVK